MLQEGVVVFDPTGTVIRFNRAALEVIGVTSEVTLWSDAVRGVAVLGVDGKPVAISEWPHMRAIRSRASLLRQRTLFRRADGEVRELLVSAVPTLDDQGAVTQVIAVFFDITGEMAMVNELRIFERFFESSADLLLVLSDDLRVQEVNAAICMVLATAREVLLGRSFLELLPPGLRDDLEARLAKTGENLDAIVSLETPGRGERTVAWRFSRSPTSLAGGAWFVRGQDITERTLEVQQITRSREQLTEAFELAELAVLERDLWTGRSSATARLRELLQLDTEVSEAFNVDEFVVPEDLAVFHKARSHQAPQAVRLKTARNEVREVRIWSRRTAAHELLVIQDVTRQSLLQAQLRLAERLTSLGTMAAGVAHEINNPLAFVLANLNVVKSELARMPDVPDIDMVDLRDAVNEAIEGAERMRQIVQGLKPFARADEHQRGHCDITRIVQASINMAKNELRHRARIVTELRQVAPVFANEARLGQVFLNLLVNAAHAMPDGHAAANLVTIVTRQEGETVIVSISDTGTGIPPEVLPRIFDPFFSTKQIGQGTGLGLFISQGIVKEAGGEMSVQSAQGMGTTFEVRLPAATPSFAPTTMTPLPVRSRARLLLVDDEPSILRSLERLLGKAHDVTLAHSGREALALLSAGLEYDLILCDLMMPETSGIDVWEKLSAEQHEKFVFMTGGTFTERAERFLAEAKPQVLEKPFTATTLEELLRRTQTR